MSRPTPARQDARRGTTRWEDKERPEWATEETS